MPDWPKEYNQQVKMLLDDSALPIEQYDAVMEEWSKGEYEKTPLGETKSLVDLQTMIAERVCATRGIKMPNYRAQAELLASRQ